MRCLPVYLNVDGGGTAAAGLCHPSIQVVMAEQLKEQSTS
jgi:hypothetical protein